MKVLLVINPVSGGRDKGEFLTYSKDTFRKYSIEHIIFKTTGKDDQTKLKSKIEEEKPDRLVACGGDGTLRLCALACSEGNIPMGVVPLGSANGLATELGINRNPEKAFIDSLLTQKIKSLDFIRINDEYCIHISDVGINANIVQAYEKDENRGNLTYAKYFFKELIGADTFKVEIKTKQKSLVEEVVMVAICNARKYGTGVPLNQTGNPFDGKFEIVLINKPNAKDILNSGLLSKENPDDINPFEVLETDSAQISFEEKQLLQIDGEVIGNFSELEIEIKKSAVKFLSVQD